jgi:hypothetical protein
MTTSKFAEGSKQNPMSARAGGTLPEAIGEALLYNTFFQENNVVYVEHFNNVALVTKSPYGVLDIQVEMAENVSFTQEKLHQALLIAIWMTKELEKLDQREIGPAEYDEAQAIVNSYKVQSGTLKVADLSIAEYLALLHRKIGLVEYQFAQYVAEIYESRKNIRDQVLTWWRELEAEKV